MKKIKLTQQEDEWVSGDLPVGRDFPTEILFEHRPRLLELLEEMRSHWENFCGLSDEMRELAWGAWNDLSYDEQQKYRFHHPYLEYLVSLDPKPEKGVRRG